jgi:prepilin-type N-terminal cleavage/methylation domain-containing protein
MKRGFTLVEIMTVLVIIVILASLGIPMFYKATREAELAEVELMVDMVSAGARYYDFKYGFASFDPSAGPVVYWKALNVDLPPHSECQYTIIAEGGKKKLLVESMPTGKVPWIWLYKYELPKDTNPSDNINSANTDSDKLGEW